MSDVVIFSLVLLVAVFIASCSQILLKREANKKHESIMSEYLNCRVFGAYSLFGISAIVSMYVLRHVPLSLVPVLESAGYIFVVMLGWIFLSEKLGGRQILGIGLIIFGILFFSFS